MNGSNWKDFVDSIHEVEAYQQKVQKGYFQKEKNPQEPCEDIHQNHQNWGR